MDSHGPHSSLPDVYAENLRKEFGEFTAVEDSTFSVDSGEVLGIVGPNGAGKTTTLKMLSGLITPTRGEAKIAGYQATDLEMRYDLGFLPEESPLYDDMTGVSYLKFFADLYDVDSDTAEERIHDSLDRLGLEHRDRKIGDMSKGMTRKVAIARSLVNDPSVLVYDEPASGLDPLSTHQIIEFTRELADEQGKTVVFSAHNLYHVESVCDRLLIMNNGHVIARGTIDEIRDEYGDTTYTITVSKPVLDASESEDGYHVVVHSVDGVERVQSAADDAGADVLDIQTDEASLEDIFLSLSDSGGDALGQTHS